MVPIDLGELNKTDHLTMAKLLTSNPTNVRTDVHRETMAMAKRYEQAVRLRLMRMNIVAAGLEVTTSGKGAGQHTHEAYGDEMIHSGMGSGLHF